MKVIFLDIDGVLNNKAYAKSLVEQGAMPFEKFCPDNVTQMNRLVRDLHDDGHAFYIVICSSWRLFHSRILMSRILIENGIKGVSYYDDRTPYIDMDKNKEIKEYLTLNPFIEDYVILIDEYPIDDDLLPHVCRTTNSSGLTPLVVDEIITRWKNFKESKSKDGTPE